jgi:sec-independent protein translocase protein TatA
MGRIGFPELLILLLVILLLFGARKLPDLARALGKSLSEFKKGREEGIKDEDKTAATDKDDAARKG